MTRMNIAKALKEKNRLAGKIKELESLVVTYNSRVEGSICHFDPKDTMGKIALLRAELLELKVAIQKKNSLIADLLVGMAEAKATVTFLRGINTREGIEKSRYGDEKDIVFVVSFDEKWKRERIEELEDSIRKMQDEVDEFNSTTFIEV